MSQGSTRQLVRTRQNRMLAGVAGGIASYFDVSPTLIRALWVIGGIAMPPMTVPIALLLYVILALVIPLGSDEK